MHKMSQPVQVSCSTSNNKDRFQMTPAKSVSAEFFKPAFVYQGASANMERHNYIKGYN